MILFLAINEEESLPDPIAVIKDLRGKWKSPEACLRFPETAAVCSPSSQWDPADATDSSTLLKLLPQNSFGVCRGLSGNDKRSYFLEQESWI